MYRLFQDLRFAIRTMLKKPGFTPLLADATALASRSASTAIFTVVDAALLRGLPTWPDQLYHLWENRPQQEFGKREFSYPDYQDYQKNNSVDLAAYTGGGGIMSGRGEPELVFSPRVSANFFSLLSVDPVIGRTFGRRG